MRRLAFACALVPLIALAGCGGEAVQETQTTTTKDGVTTTTITKREVDRGTATGSGVKIDSDQFKADVEIPGLTFAAGHLDLNGMKLYPGSTVKGMHVHAVDRSGVDKGDVVVDFTSPAAPATVAQHMADQARTAGYAVTTDNATSLSGVKTGGGDRDSFTATLNRNGNATVGQLTLVGKN